MTSDSEAQTDSQTEPGRRKFRHALIVLCTVIVLAGSVIGCVWIGEGGSLLVRVATVIEIVTNSAWMPVVYLLGAWGYGRAIWSKAGEIAWVARLGIGLSLMLSLTHLFGILGVLDQATAWGLTGVGLVLAATGAARDWSEIERRVRGVVFDRVSTTFFMVSLVVCGLMIVAACQPAGVLWDSEYGNYDSLSYHLELPRVWMESGRVWPVEWNVYSFLPSYVEAAYAHMGMLAGLGSDGLGLASGDGEGIYAAQFLSVMMTILASLAAGSVAEHACGVLHLDNGVRKISGWIARLLVLTTPWMMVVGTISYNESAVVLLTMCGIAIALETEWSVMKRTVGVAVVMGAACSCKPTALFLAAPMVGIVLIAQIHLKSWWKVVLVGTLVGSAVLMPWLVRNELATGNPVFPMMSGVFGDGHWDASQHARYAAAHSFDGNWIQRAAILVMPDQTGATHVARYRGLTNMQWGVTAGMGMLGLIVLLLIKKTHKAGAVCVLGVGVVLLSWMGMTHLQSRFLVPMVGVFGVLGALGVAAIGDWLLAKQWKISATGGLFSVLVVSACVPVVLLANQFARQAGGHPNGLLVAGCGAFTGEVGHGSFDQMLWWGGVNHATETGDGIEKNSVYLIGDATAVYVRSPVVYNTTYDAWLIGDLMRVFPTDTSAWERELSDRGIGWVVINLSEIDRLAESGWGDPEVTSGAMIQWARGLGPPTHTWNGGRRVMFRIGSSGMENPADEGNP